MNGIKRSNSKVTIDTAIWMRPKRAIQELKKRNMKVSYQLMNAWIKQKRIQSTKVKELDLILVNIKTAPTASEVRV